MVKLTAAWNEFFFAETSARPLRVFRAVFGSFLVFYYARLFDLLQLHYGTNGIVDATTFAERAARLKLSLLAYTGGDVRVFLSLYALSLLAGALLASGFAPRVAAAATWLLHLTWFNPLLVGNNGGDGMVQVLSFGFVLAAFAGHLDRSRATVPVWTVRLFQIQLCLVYFFSGVHKLASPDWYRGEALHWVFFQSVWTRFNLEPLTHPFLVGALTYSTALFELLLFPVLVWPKATRPYVLFGGVAFHLGIVLTMKVFVFSAIMPLSYLCFVGEDWQVVRHFETLGDRLHSYTQRLRKNRKNTTAA